MIRTNSRNWTSRESSDSGYPPALMTGQRSNQLNYVPVGCGISDLAEVLMIEGVLREAHASQGVLAMAADPGRSARDERIIGGFEEIQRFVEKHSRNPQHGEERDIFERLYSVRWWRTALQWPRFIESKASYFRTREFSRTRGESLTSMPPQKHRLVRQPGPDMEYAALRAHSQGLMLLILRVNRPTVTDRPPIHIHGMPLSIKPHSKAPSTFAKRFLSAF
jgi:hypothetical protein